MSHLALKIIILSFVIIFSSARLSNSSALCMMSLWHETCWLSSCISQLFFFPPYWLCPQNMVVTVAQHPLRIQNTCCLSLLLEGNKGLQKSGRLPLFHLAELLSTFLCETCLK